MQSLCLKLLGFLTETYTACRGPRAPSPGLRAAGSSGPQRSGPRTCSRSSGPPPQPLWAAGFPLPPGPAAFPAKPSSPRSAGAEAPARCEGDPGVLPAAPWLSPAPGPSLPLSVAALELMVRLSSTPRTRGVPGAATRRRPWRPVSGPAPRAAGSAPSPACPGRRARLPLLAVCTGAAENALRRGQTASHSSLRTEPPTYFNPAPASSLHRPRLPDSSPPSLPPALPAPAHSETKFC